MATRLSLHSPPTLTPSHVSSSSVRIRIRINSAAAAGSITTSRLVAMCGSSNHHHISPARSDQNLIKVVVFEDKTSGIVCYKDENGEIVCEGYDEGPRLQHHHHHHQMSRFAHSDHSSNSVETVEMLQRCLAQDTETHSSRQAEAEMLEERFNKLR
ncbi:uncharacterized protein LOC127262865 [Andrographis paniculata]|uniref:uncharacterized protein LOC127262865 n=1 Tax=Andrographis paniculata TaxID=175694 RepID=UPI0021E80223|nr:uncharacterized protein LOC127262865 [Andrographis paniculata]